jgi:hypothetical protein
MYPRSRQNLDQRIPGLVADVTLATEPDLTEIIPRIGLFWVAPDSHGAWVIHDIARSAPEVPLIGGFRTHEVGHAQAWPRLRGSLSREYGDYPRGRVNWRAEDERYLLLLDPVLCRDGWRERIMHRFYLPEAETLVMTDSHYRSCHHPPPNQSIRRRDECDRS